MHPVKSIIFFILFFIFPGILCAQQKDLGFFIDARMKQDPALRENGNIVQNLQIQKEIITAQNKKPLVSFTADYLLAPFFFDNGKVISITNNPSPKAYGYDVGITNGGLYAAQLNVSIPVFNKASLNNLYAQNKAETELADDSAQRIRYEAEKEVSDQYIISYQFLQQTYYLQKIIDRLKDRKPLVEALVKKGLLQQNDYLLLDIQLLNSINDLRQMQYAYINGISILRNLALITDTSAFILAKPDIFIRPNPEQYYYMRKFALDSIELISSQHVFNNRYKTQVSVSGSGGVNATEITNAYRNIGVSAAVHVGVPIRDGRQRKLNDRSTALLLENKRIYRDNASLQLANNLRNAARQIDQWKETVVMDDELIKKQELLLDIIKDKVIQGQVTVMDYINALQDYNVMLKNRAIAQSNILLYINLYNYYNH